MPMYFVKLLTPLCGEIEANDEKEAIEKLKDSISQDNYDNNEFEVEEIEIVKQEYINI